MNRNGIGALAFHSLFVVFMLAPIAIVCVVAFTPEGFLSIPTTDWSLRWFRAIARYPEFVDAFWKSLAHTFRNAHDVILAPWGETIVNARCVLHGTEMLFSVVVWLAPPRRFTRKHRFSHGFRHAMPRRPQ